MRAIGYGESLNIDRSTANKNSSSSTPTNNFSSAIFYFAFLTRFPYCSSETDSTTVIFSHPFSMNIDAKEFFRSSETRTQSTTTDEGDHLFTVSKANHQTATARSILHEWNMTTTLCAHSRMVD